MKKTNGILALIVAVVVAFIATMGYLSYSNYRKSIKTFHNGGYVLVTSYNDANEAISEKHYFDDNTEYKRNYSGQVQFKDLDQQKVSVEQNNFVHYNDNSIGVLQKSVIFDFNEIQNSTKKYYNIFDSTVLEYVGGTYYVDNLDKQLKFDKFVVKISDSKYLIFAPDFSINLDKDNKVDLKDYIELSFIDNNVIRIVNQEKTYQTITNEAKINIDNITIDLSNKNIYLDSNLNMNLNDIVINSDDNIEIVAPDEKEEEKKADDEKKDDSSNTQGTTGSTNGNGTTPTGDQNGSDTDNENNNSSVSGTNDSTKGEITAVDEGTLKIPTAVLEDLTSGTTTCDFAVRITDDDSLITGNLTVTVRDTATNKVVYLKNISSGEYNIYTSLENLTPDTGYMITLNGNYTKNDVVYNTDMIQKIFVTDSVGLNVEKNYYTTEKLSFYVNLDSASEVGSFDATLLDSNLNVVKEIKIKANDVKNDGTLTFNELKSNTKYTLKISNIVYENFAVSNGYTLEKSAKTLKERPTMGKPMVNVNKKDGTFEIGIYGNVDNQNSIEKYVYEIYDAKTLKENLPPVYTVEKSDLNTLTVKVDDQKIFRNSLYVVKITALAYDNEKYIEYYSSLSDVCSLTGLSFPTISWKENSITFEKIDGIITINDPDSTINLSKTMKVIYTNSIGTSYSYVTNGSLKIPFVKNNLRANDSYTISVYASIDLQDGNNEIDEQFIGSVIVLTAQTRELNSTMYNNESTGEYAFDVTGQLSDYDKDASLEASTMTYLTFNLYSGSDTSGQLIKSVHKVDHDGREYVSDLMSDYYAKTFNLTPAFFGIANSDLTSENYTIEVTGAMDYTDFKNVIPIENNTITVKTSGTMPDVPTDRNNTIQVDPIINKNAGEKYNSNLDPYTVVGYKIKTTYANGTKTAARVNYHLFNADTNEKIPNSDKTVEYSNDGTVDYCTYYLEDYGTPSDVEDTDFRRGNNYYFTYDMELTLNPAYPDAITYWPPEGVILTSKTISPEKQSATFKFVPSVSDDKTYTFKYMYSDFDNVLDNNNIYSYIAGVPTSIQKVEKTTEFKNITFDSLSNGLFKIIGKEKKIKNDDSTDEVYLSQEFKTKSKIGTLSYNLFVETNNLKISIADYKNKSMDTSRIAALKADFTCDGETITIDGIKIDRDTGSALVDLFKLKKFLGKTISTKVYAYYDTDSYGYDVGSEFVTLSSFNDDGGMTYLSINEADTYSYVDDTNYIMYKMTNDENSYTYTSALTSFSRRIPVIYKKNGITFGYESLVPKAIDVSELNASTSSTFSFSVLLLGVSLSDENISSTITSTLNSISMKMTLKGFSDMDIQNNEVILKLYEQNDSVLTNEKIYKINVNDLNKYYTIEDLTPNTHYAFKLYAGVKNGSTGLYEEKQLYDIDSGSANKTYTISTKAGIEITEFTADYVAASYNSKKLEFQFNISTKIGYNELRYKLYKKGVDQDGFETLDLVDIDIPSSTSFVDRMTVDVPCNPGSVIEFGKSYQLEITPIFKKAGSDGMEDVALNTGKFSFNLESLKRPIVGIRKSYDANDELNIKVSIYDSDKVVVGGIYKFLVQDEDGIDVTPSVEPCAYKGNEYDIYTLNRSFSLASLDKTKNYKVIVLSSIDTENNINSATEYQSTLNITSDNFNNFLIGDVFVSKASSKQLLLNYYDSYNLAKIDTVIYKVYKKDSSDSQDFSAPFVLNENGTGDYYYFKLSDKISLSDGLYYIQMQYLSNGVIIQEDVYEYSYSS